MSAPILELFWDLAEVDDAKRVSAAAALCSTLATQQAAHTGDGACSDLSYTVRRLVRGLASSRDGARQGFGAALIEVLRAFSDHVDLDGVLKVMEDAMALHGSMDGAEERDAIFGRCFTCASIVRSGRLASMSASARGSIAAKLAKELAACSAKKSFLHELCAVLQCELLEALPSSEIQTAVWPHISAGLAPPLAEWSAGALLIALRLGRLLKHATLAALLPHVTLKNGSLLHMANLASLVGPLKTASLVHPRLHAVWDELVELLGAGRDGRDPAPPTPAAAPSGKKGKKGKSGGGGAAAEPLANGPSTDEAAPRNGGGGGGDVALLRGFWQTVVEEALVPSTLERKFMCFELLQRALPALSAAQVPLLLSPALLRCLVNALEGSDRMLRPAATKTLKALAASAESSPPLRVALVSGLLGRGRGGEYDRTASTKALRLLLSQGTPAATFDVAARRGGLLGGGHLHV